MDQNEILRHWKIFFRKHIASLTPLERTWALELVARNATIERAYALGDLFRPLDRKFIELLVLGDIFGDGG